MSAWIVGRAHIDVLLAGARAHRLEWGGPHSLDNLDAVGQMLHSENIASIQSRYPDVLDGGTYPGPIGFDPAVPYSFTDPGFVPTPMELLSTTDCLDYQSCEHPGWRASEAKRFCVALEAAIGPKDEAGWNAAPWGWSDEDIAKRRSIERIA